MECIPLELFLIPINLIERRHEDERPCNLTIKKWLAHATCLVLTSFHLIVTHCMSVLYTPSPIGGHQCIEFLNAQMKKGEEML
jgi:hypothetical protein